MFTTVASGGWGAPPPRPPCDVRLSSVHVYHLVYHGKWETAQHQECDMVVSEDGVRADYHPCTTKSVRLPRCPLTPHTAERVDQNECCCAYTRALHEVLARKAREKFFLAPLFPDQNSPSHFSRSGESGEHCQKFILFFLFFGLTEFFSGFG